MNDLGFSIYLDKTGNLADIDGARFARVVSERKDSYLIRGSAGEFAAEIAGNLRYAAAGREDLPVVGDWVEAAVQADGPAIIHRVLPRYSLIRRRAAGRDGETQPIAANVDYGIVVQAADRDFSLNRMERYLVICRESGIEPIVVVTKIDAASDADLGAIREGVERRLAGAPAAFVSNKTLSGMDALRSLVLGGRTYCLLGSSGAGKSSLLNNLADDGQARDETARTGEISDATGKGRHTTSSRDLYPLPSGAILIDNPGMREVGVAASESGLERAFDAIAEIARECRFADCAHEREAGCAVIAAVRDGRLDEAAYENYRKIKKENDFFSLTAEELHRRDRAFGRNKQAYKKGERQRDG